MQIPLYQLDAFTNRVFGGNPAAICPLDAWLPDAVLQYIALENNLSETAFFVPVRGDSQYHLRWFTPKREVDLCGHATLASAAVIFRDFQPDIETIVFESLSGPLRVRREAHLIELDFPARPPAGEAPATEAIVDALGERPETVLQAREPHAIFADAETVRTLSPRIDAIAALNPGRMIVSAPDESGDADYVCRFFAPASGIPEDPVTGSIQCTLGPYWGRRLGKETLKARQLSERRGDFQVTLSGDRVRIAGEAVFVLEGTLTVPDCSK